MIYQVHVPGPPLGQFVEHLWFHEGYSPDYRMERMLPDGAIELIIDLREEPKKLYDRRDHSRFQSFKEAWISGQHQKYLVIESAFDSCMIGARFRPGGAFPFFRFSMSELNNSVVPLDLVWGGRVSLLRERLLEAATVPQRFRILEGFLLRQAVKPMEPEAALWFCIRQLAKSPAFRLIRELADEVGISQRQLLRKFDRRVGLRPKLLARVFKFQRALRQIEGERPLVWSHLACDCGYYDQAHFIHEFQGFSGMNPSRYLVERGEFFNWIPIRS